MDTRHPDALLANTLLISREKLPFSKIITILARILTLKTRAVKTARPWAGFNNRVLANMILLFLLADTPRKPPTASQFDVSDLMGQTPNRSYMTPAPMVCCT